MRRYSISIVLVVLVAAGVSLSLLRAQAPTNPAISAPSIVPNLLTVNTPTVLTVTVSIPDPTLNPTSVELYRVNSAGTSTTLVAQMNDDGRNGDQKPGDKVFTALLNLSEPRPLAFGFQVSAVFRGRQPVVSPIQEIAALAPHSLPVILPPDPGDAGKATLAGIDSDRDGVRDDIQRYIVFKYPDSEHTRAAMMQMARSAQLTLIEANNETVAKGNFQLSINGGTCLGYLIGVRESLDAEKRLLAELLNSKDRIQAWALASRYVAGETFKVLASDAARRGACVFDPSAMEN